MSVELLGSEVSDDVSLAVSLNGCSVEQPAERIKRPDVRKC